MTSWAVLHRFSVAETQLKRIVRVLVAAMIAFQVPEENKGKFPDAGVRAALMSATMRTTVPIDEQLGLVPIVFDNLSGLRPFRVLGNSSIFLTDGQGGVFYKSVPLPGAPSDITVSRW